MSLNLKLPSFPVIALLKFQGSELPLCARGPTTWHTLTYHACELLSETETCCRAVLCTLQIRAHLHDIVNHARATIQLEVN